jgi:hypothetical protein
LSASQDASNEFAVFDEGSAVFHVRDPEVIDPVSGVGHRILIDADADEGIGFDRDVGLYLVDDLLKL